MGDLQQLLKQYFGYDHFRPLQQDIIHDVLAGKDVFVLMPTGGGKSLCYQLPALKLPGLTLVISPLIALMKDQVDGLKANGVPAELINSSIDFNEIESVKAGVRNGKVKILYISPERLATDSFIEFLKEINLSLIAIDEAHCISEWGHDFRPDYRNLQDLKKIFTVPIIALTATATQKVQEDICKQLNLKEPKIFVSSFNRENLQLHVLPKKGLLPQLTALLDKYSGESTIVYCFSRKKTEQLAEDLRAKGFKALPYHAGLTDIQRQKHQEAFVRDEVDIIVATIAFGMGIDKPDVRLVVHETFPKTLEGYYQEVGRAGRDGLKSECVMFYSYGDVRNHQFFIDQLEDAKAKEASMRKLRLVIDFAENFACRRQFILRYFGENHQGNCHGCDNCLRVADKFDATEIAQKILSCVYRLGNRFGKGHVVDVLRGQSNPRIESWKQNKLAIFGIAAEHSRDELMQLIDSLIICDFLERSEGQYPVLAVSNKGLVFLKDRQSIELPKPRITPKVTKTQERTHKKLAPTGDFDQELFEKLRVLRKSLADEKSVPPFVIFGDVSLRAMAKSFPKTPDQFLEIHGVGQSKLEKFGEDFMQIIRGHNS